MVYYMPKSHVRRRKDGKRNADMKIRRHLRQKEIDLKLVKPGDSREL